MSAKSVKEILDCLQVDNTLAETLRAEETPSNEDDSPPHASTPIDAEESAVEAGSKKPCVHRLCDLCNDVIVDSEEDHILQQHFDIARSVDQLLSSELPAVDGCDVNTETVSALGTYILRAVRNDDQGKQMFKVIQEVWAQLNILVRSREDAGRFYLFGSCVSMGIWDGMGDADFTFFSPHFNRGKEVVPSKRTQNKVLCQVASCLRECGFFFNEFEVLHSTRVPLVRRKRGLQVSYNLRRATEPFAIVYRFSSANAFTAFQNKKAIESFYNGSCVSSPHGPAEWRRGLEYTFTRGVCAIAAYNRNEAPGIMKSWKVNARLPELFGVDFDISARPFGVRNSCLLRAYMMQDHIFRAGNLFIKKWSKACGINNSRAGYLTSYAMSVLWVYYLLRCGEARFVDPNSIPEFPDPDASQESVQYLPLWPESSESEEARQIQRLGSLVQGFFRFFAEDFDWTHDVVSICEDCSNGTNVVSLDSLGWKPRTDCCQLRDRLYCIICIQDVYEKNLNLGRHLSPLKSAWLKAQIVTASHLCRSSVGLDKLLVNCHERAAETLQVTLFRALCATDGVASVAAVRTALLAGDPFLLPTYLVHHRMCDLWYDTQRTDAHLPRAPHPFSEAAGNAGGKKWAALHNPVQLPACGNGDDDGGCVFLSNKTTHAIADPSELRAALCAATRAARAEFQKIAESMTESDALGTDLSQCEALTQQLFFEAGGSGFLSFEERATFVEHLRAVGLALLATDDFGSLRPGGTVTRNEADHRDAIIAERCQHFATTTTLHGSTLHAILRCDRYVIWPDGGGSPSLTTELLRYVGEVGKEEVVQRQKTGKNHKKSSTNTVKRKSVPITRDASSHVVGFCDQCHKKNVTVYPTTKPMLDWGSYCMPCWNKYLR